MIARKEIQTCLSVTSCPKNGSVEGGRDISSKNHVLEYIDAKKMGIGVRRNTLKWHKYCNPIFKKNIFI